MNLVGKKVILRAIEEKDLEISRETTNNPNVEASIIGWSVPISKKNQIDWFKNEHNTFTNIRYVIATKENDEAIGMIGLYNIDWKNGVVPSFGLKIFNTNNRKKGLAFDALMTLLKYVFYELRLNRVEYKTLYFNKAALNVVAKAGFQIEGEKREAVYKNGKFNNVITGGCLKSDYEKKLEETHYWDENFDTVNPPPDKKQMHSLYAHTRTRSFYKIFKIYNKIV